MAVTGLNHLTLAVSNLDRSISFYSDLLGFNLRKQWGKGAYLEAGTLWLCLFMEDNVITRPRPDYTHYALTVEPEDFAALSARILHEAPIWQINQSEGPSVYFLDPDGHKLELHIGSLDSRLGA